MIVSHWKKSYYQTPQVKWKHSAPKISNFKSVIWAKSVNTIANKCYLAKFTQKPQMKDCLMSNNDNDLIETSPSDNIWGIGMAMH